MVTDESVPQPPKVTVSVNVVEVGAASFTVKVIRPDASVIRLVAVAWTLRPAVTCAVTARPAIEAAKISSHSAVKVTDPPLITESVDAGRIVQPEADAVLPVTVKGNVAFETAVVTPVG